MTSAEKAFNYEFSFTYFYRFPLPYPADGKQAVQGVCGFCEGVYTEVNN